MPAPIYTEEEAAIHELGHAVVACALNIDFKNVFISPMPNPTHGWRGQCVLGNNFPADQRVLQDAFLMGGPLMQLVAAPISLGPYQNAFCPSLFSDSPEHAADKGAVINLMRWQSDLLDTYMIQTAPNFPFMHLWTGRVGERPWLLDVEARIRTFFMTAELQALMVDLRAKLVTRKDIPATEVRARLAVLVSEALLKTFRDPILAIPNVPPPAFGPWKIGERP